MDDFRVGSISQYEPYREDQTAPRVGDRKERRQKAPQDRKDEFESTVEQAEAEAEAGAESHDYYVPSEPADE